MPEPLNLLIDQVVTLLKSKHGLTILFSVSCFFGGIYAAPTPETDIDELCRPCKKEKDKCKGKKEGLEDKNEKLKKQLKKALSSCNERVRRELDAKEVKCVERIGKRTEKIKEQFIDFKCTNCKRLGKCK